MLKRFENKVFNETNILNILYLLSMTLYIGSQLLFRGFVKDPIFIILLSIGTIFINYRQYFIYKRVSNENAINFYKVINDNNYQNEIKQIFDKRLYDLGSILYAIVFGLVVFLFVSKESDIQIKSCLSIYLMCANIPTGLAIIRLILLMLYTNKWTNQLVITYENDMNTEINFIFNNRDFITINAIFYVSVCLTSVLFSEFYLGSIYIVYTVFAIIMVVMVYYIQTINIKNRRDEAIKNVKKDIEKLIKQEVIKNINDAGYCSSDKIKVYNEILETFNNRRILDLGSIASIIFSIVIAIIPVLIQWILKLL